MKKSVFVEELEADRFVESVFQLTSKVTGTTRKGERYARWTLRDKTGEVEARVWAGAPALDVVCDVGDFVWVQARSEAWKGAVQLNIADMVVLDRDAIQLSEYMAASRFDASSMMRVLRDLIDTKVRSAWVRRFLDTLLAYPDVARAIEDVPAAVRNHHATLSGLLEHISSMLRVALSLADHYELYYPGMIDRDLLFVGVVVHDIGKIYELQYNGSLTYTTHGSLVGHIVSGSILVERVAQSIPDFPQELLTLIQHLVVSHHGKLEYGSPRPPQTIEAYLLHQVDMMDSRLNAYSALLPKAQDHTTHRTAFSSIFGTTMHIPPPEGYAWSTLPKTDPNALQSPGMLDPSNTNPIAQAKPLPNTQPQTPTSQSTPLRTEPPPTTPQPKLFALEPPTSSPNIPPPTTQLADPPKKSTPKHPTHTVQETATRSSNPPTTRPSPRPAPRIPLLDPKRTMRSITDQPEQHQLNLLASPPNASSSDSL